MATQTGPQLATDKTVPSPKNFFAHIEGLRALAAFLVVFYHFFTERSAGAVDVFFILTGFLVVSALSRRVHRGLEGVRDFLKGLFLRLGPVSLLVLVATFIGSLFFIPAVNRTLLNRELIATALYLENWQLIVQGADYLDRSEPPSPVLHFWAMSVQMQFYLTTALIFVVLVLFSRIASSESKARRFLAWTFGGIFVVSFSYSVYLTHFVDSDWAYFDSTARAWEFAIGAMLALVLQKWPDLSLHWIWGWIGVAGIFAAGAIVAPVFPFPGFAALVPTLSAVLVILGGRGSEGTSVGRILGSKPLVSLGGIAYTLYLVHWPLLVFYRRGFEQEVDLLEGAIIIAVSIVLSYALRHGVELPLMRRKYGNSSGRLLLLTFVPLLIVAIALPANEIVRTNQALSAGSASGSDDLLVDFVKPDNWYPESVSADELIPPLDLVYYARPSNYDDMNSQGVPCHLDRSSRDFAAWCEYGVSDNPNATIALVGASHEAQWLPALKHVAEERNWRIMALTAADCRFSALHPEGDRYRDCDEVSAKMLAGILEMNPDMVFTTANVGIEDSPSADRIAYWEQITAQGIPIVALRDNPYFESSPSECLSLHLEDPETCAVAQSEVLSENFSLAEAPDGVGLVDITEEYCDGEYCPAVIGNILVWRDDDHFTKQYVLTMTRALEQGILEVWSPPESSQVREDVLGELIEQARF